jgi:hypothetical protein
MLNELVFVADVTCIILISNVENKLSIAYPASKSSQLLTRLWHWHEIPLFVQAFGTGPMPTELTILRLFLG